MCDIRMSIKTAQAQLAEAMYMKSKEDATIAVKDMNSRLHVEKTRSCARKASNNTSTRLSGSTIKIS